MCILAFLAGIVVGIVVGIFLVFLFAEQYYIE